ncbi:hypothetical protein SKAU_G00188110 [Synaphobranchus kaupii]|uniref:Uncharacterized protein n=1 Tax=Synaphobranchus kaupii TaxID=118154 RepID=A0A9Q1IUX5_SYNKA|nr:hypothetical protein SKAU_G00188110 [Synaphobranchus kaupii]
MRAESDPADYRRWGRITRATSSVLPLPAPECLTCQSVAGLTPFRQADAPEQKPGSVSPTF